MARWVVLVLVVAGCVDGDELRAGLKGVSETGDRVDAAEVDGGRPDAAGGDRGIGGPVDRGVDATADQGDGCGPEQCNGADDDCDGEVDEAIEMPCGPPEAGVGQCLAGRLSCNNGLLSECVGAIGPADEFCDTVDNDCDGQIDEGLECACEAGQTQECFSGTPAQDGVGACRPGLQACLPDRLVFGPCTEEVAPRMEECNGVDDDCDGRTDEGVVQAGETCDVGRGACARPGVVQCGPEGRICMGEPGLASDESCDGTDEDCDGRVDEGFGIGDACEAGEGACRFAGRLECVDGAPTCVGAAGGPEDENVCNGEDDDCDGIVDEQPPCYDGPANTQNVGECRGGRLSCDAGCAGQVLPRDELCNGDDDDCDGAVDEGRGCDCTPGERNDCYEGDGVSGVGICRDGTRTCRADHTWGPCEGQIGPRAEACNGQDDDCDGAVDERITRDCGTDTGRCRTGIETCVNGAFDGDCDGSVGPRAERCSGQDDDCDGTIDEIPERACGSAVGVCESGVERCRDGDLVCEGAIGGGDEACNRRDDDCDGRTDEGVANACGECGPEPREMCNRDDDDCDGRVDEGVTNACGGCGAVPDEACDGDDNDCDGRVDEGVTNACGGCGAVPDEACDGDDNDCDGRVDEGVQSPCGGCGPVPSEDCNGEDDDCDGRIDEGATNACGECGPVPEEACNGIDDDCDRAVDEGVRNACGQCGLVPVETCNGDDDDCDGRVDEGGDRWCQISTSGQADACRAGSCRCGNFPACDGDVRCLGGVCEELCGNPMNPCQ